ncbi:unnamed protein product [Trichobilharzia regenti]|nr:unnamed protein product [Trichobilharzia regenti]
MNSVQESLSRLMKSSIVIEVWSKWMSGLPDHLIGLVKIPTESIVKLYAHYDLNSSQIWWHSNSVIQSLLKAQHPMIPVDSWFPITDPFSGSECGQLHILLAVGTQEQINTFSSVQNLKYNIDNMYMMNRETIGDGGGGAVEHRISITIEQLRDFDPHISLKHDPHFDGSVPWGDLDCFVQYFFPIGELFL